MILSILDAYGHISVRHHQKHDVFIMPRNVAPALVCSANDLIEYYVDNASAVETEAPVGYVERYIHSEIYKRYPGIHSVIHSHSEAVIPYSISSKKKYSGGCTSFPIPYANLRNRSPSEIVFSHGWVLG